MRPDSTSFRKPERALALSSFVSVTWARTCVADQDGPNAQTSSPAARHASATASGLKDFPEPAEPSVMAIWSALRACQAAAFRQSDRVGRAAIAAAIGAPGDLLRKPLLDRAKLRRSRPALTRA